MEDRRERGGVGAEGGGGGGARRHRGSCQTEGFTIMRSANAFVCSFLVSLAFLFMTLSLALWMASCSREFRFNISL